MPEAAVPEIAAPPALQTLGLTKRFARTAPPVLERIDLSVPRNQFVCLLGGSGCGKTTLLRLLAGLEKAEAGRVRIDGEDVKGPGGKQSMVFQNYGLLPWRTVLGNVELGLEVRGASRQARRNTARLNIERVGLAGFEQHYPHQLSGGMQQRVALARAFAKDPSVLLMDEPFAAVDMQTRELLQGELLDIWSSVLTTVVFVTHSIDEAIFLSDRVIVLAPRPGRIVLDVLTDLPRPRGEHDKGSAQFVSLQRRRRDALREGNPALRRD